MKTIMSVLLAVTALLALGMPTSADVTVTGQSIKTPQIKKAIGQAYAASDIPVVATTFTVDTDAVFSAVIKPVANSTVTLTNHVAGRVIRVVVLQDATGSRTITWTSPITWSGGTAPTLTTTANKRDIFEFYDNGTNYYGRTFGLNY